jgi:hypothetical protein
MAELKSPVTDPDVCYKFECSHLRAEYKFGYLDFLLLKDTPVIYFRVEYTLGKKTPKMRKGFRKVHDLPKIAIHHYRFQWDNGQLAPMPGKLDFEVFNNRNHRKILDEWNYFYKNGLLIRSGAFDLKYRLCGDHKQGCAKIDTLLDAVCWLRAIYNLKIKDYKNFNFELHGFLDKIKNTFLEYMFDFFEKYNVDPHDLNAEVFKIIRDEQHEKKSR